MLVFEVAVALLLLGAVLAAIARRIGTPYPALVALAGAALALVPGTPTVTLDPELALALFVAPVLLDAAFDASPRDLRANWLPVVSLALGAVVLTVITVAVVTRALVPGIPWAAAIALGAIVAPPDAAAATAVLRQLRPPHRTLVILEGESLFNDASALIIYRLAVGSAAVGALSGWSIVPTLLVVTVGSIVLGLVLSRVILVVNRFIHDVATAVIVQFVGTFAVWLIAERLALSPIITMVVFAMAVARVAPDRMPARLRIPSYAVWEVAVFVLNVLAFILVGLQLKPIVARLDRATWLEYSMVAVTVIIVVIAARIAWVTGAAAFSRWRCRPRTDGTPGPSDAVALSPRGAALVAWCGMRGTVTLAAALALPTLRDGVPPFPYRDLILFTAFSVVLGTLVLQGMTLRPLMARLHLSDDGAVDREVRLARVETLRAAVGVLATAPEVETVELLRRRFELRLRHAEGELHGASPADDSRASGELAGDADTLRAAMAAERHRLSALRADGTIGDDAFHLVEEELDWAELAAESVLRAERTDGGAG
jgi:CPA1 family monovalent cation:H+ antiporter